MPLVQLIRCVCALRKNNIDHFIPDRQPDFPDEKFQKVSGDPFFIDENVLVKTPLLLKHLCPSASVAFSVVLAD